MAGGLALFVILIGVVTIKTWPQLGGLFPGGGRDASLQSTATPAAAGVRRTLEPQPCQPARRELEPAGSPRAAESRRPGVVNGLAPGENGGAIGGAPDQPGADGGQPQGAQPPPTDSQPPSNAVSQLLSGTGNTVDGATDEPRQHPRGQQQSRSRRPARRGRPHPRTTTSSHSPVSTSADRPLASRARASAAPRPAAPGRAGRWYGRHPAR